MREREDININQNIRFTSYNWFYQSEPLSNSLFAESLQQHDKLYDSLSLSLSRDKRLDLIEVLMEMSITFALPDTCACF